MNSSAEILTQCPLCGSIELEKFYEGIDQYYSEQFIQCSACRHCSLIFLNPRPSAAEYKEWYESVFQDKRRNFTTVEQVIRDIKEKDKYNKKLKELVHFKDFINKGSSCLEIGGGWGTLARVITDAFGCSIDVIEPSTLAAQVGREYFKLNVYNKTFERFAEQERGRKNYDLIYAYHVFEHIADPNSFLERVKYFLKPGGALLMALPDMSRPEAPSEKLFHIEHCFYYTPATAEMMLNKHGFQVKNVWRCKDDIKVMNVKGAPAQSTIFENSAEYKKVKKAVKRYNQKYAILRFIKKILFYPLSDEQKNKANQFISNLFQK